MSEKKTIRVVAAVIKEDDRIFATARGYGEYKGWWEFPGGKIKNPWIAFGLRSYPVRSS